MFDTLTPFSRKKEFIQETETNAEESTSSESWFGVIGGVMGELFQNLGIFSVLRKRGWGTSGSKSTSNLASSFRHSTSCIPEQIELQYIPQKNSCYLFVDNFKHGRGHNFNSLTLERPTWCDVCAHLIFYHASTCNHCNFICHEQCQPLVLLDCSLITCDSDDENSFEIFDVRQSSTLTGKDLVEVVQDGNDGPLDETTQSNEVMPHFEIPECVEISTLRRTAHQIKSNVVDESEIEEWIKKSPFSSVALQINQENDGSYRGCIRIHLNLRRPISIVAGSRPPSIYDILQDDKTLEKTLTSFYMPRDAVKAIHISNKTTTREVIVALLKKFKVVDNPQKFALYEMTYDTAETIKGKLVRLSDNDCPLALAMTWNAEGIANKRLFLQENDTADIQWEAFSLPELNNFLRILDREEHEYLNQIRSKYNILKTRMQTRLAEVGGLEKR